MSKVVVIPKPGKFDEFIGCKVTAQQKARFYELGGVATLRRMLDSSMQPAAAPPAADGKPNFDDAERFKCEAALSLHAEMTRDLDFTREENGFAQEIALQYGFEYIDDDAQILAVRANDLHVFMRALGYLHNPVSDIRGGGK